MSNVHSNPVLAKFPVGWCMLELTSDMPDDRELWVVRIGLALAARARIGWSLGVVAYV